MQQHLRWYENVKTITHNMQNTSTNRIRRKNPESVTDSGHTIQSLPPELWQNRPNYSWELSGRITPLFRHALQPPSCKIHTEEACGNTMSMFTYQFQGLIKN